VKSISAVLLLISALVLGGNSASASHRNNTNPSSSGCSSTGQSASAGNIRQGNGTIIGVIELRYSTGCHTSWARITTSNTYMTNSFPCTGITNLCGVAMLRNTSCVGSVLESWSIPVGAQSVFTEQWGGARTTCAQGSMKPSGVQSGSNLQNTSTYAYPH
jgi:Protein of unknown function (DUF2690)